MSGPVVKCELRSPFTLKQLREFCDAAHNAGCREGQTVGLSQTLTGYNDRALIDGQPMPITYTTLHANHPPRGEAVKIHAPENPNYAATIVEVPEPMTLPGLDNLVGIPMYGYQALTQKGIRRGDLRVLFTTETELDTEYAHNNNLNRDATLNADPTETGYLEKHRRIKAVKLRGNRSNALLMPLDSLAYTGFPIDQLRPGDTFDSLNGHPICRKYVPPVKPGSQRRVGPKIRHRVDQRHFPMHLDTEHFFRNLDQFRDPTRIVVTQKLHGTSWRGGRVPVQRDKRWFERLINRLGVKTPDFAYEDVFGSRHVIKGHDGNNHYYDTDVWTEYGKTIADVIPDGFVVYGELVGWTSTDSAIQAGYTYHLLPGQVELYVYRVATINERGNLADLSWEGVKEFCAGTGLKHVPELAVKVLTLPDWFAADQAVAAFTEQYLDQRLADTFPEALIVSSHKTVDEGVCVRAEGIVPRIYKAKSPLFYEWETKQLDNGDADIEAAA